MSIRGQFGNDLIDKKEFYKDKTSINLIDVDLNKIVVSNKWKINDTTCKYYIGYKNDDEIKPLCVIMPQMTGYVKYFDDGGKNMSFISECLNVYDKYSAIWNKIEKLLKIKFSVNPVRDDKYHLLQVKNY